MTGKGKIGAVAAACAVMFAGAFASGCAETKATPSHEHTYNESDWMQDDAGHWRGSTCGHGLRKDYGIHVYDNDADADCNVCGRLREINENKDPADSRVEEPEVNEGKPETKPAGFIVGYGTDGLIVEGISAEYALSLEKRALNFNTLGYKVYLAEGGAKGAEVPEENYQTTVYYGGNAVENVQELTADGSYSATITLVGACYENGESVSADKVSALIQFNIDNGVQTLTFTGGRTEQVLSRKDKMSESWTFEAVRANGDTESVDVSKTELAQPDTETTGTRTTTVTYAGAESEIEYTVMPVPEIVKGEVDISAKVGREIETDGEYAQIGVGDFNIGYAADAAYTYSVKTTLVYDGVEAESFRLQAGEKAHSVTVRVSFVYTVEGDKIAREYSKEFNLTVRKKPVDTGGPITLSGAEIAGGEKQVRIVQQADFASSVNGTDLEIRYSGDDMIGATYSGLVINVDEASIVKIRLTIADGALVQMDTGDGPDDGQNADGEAEIVFSFAEAGEYTLYIVINNPEDTIIIHGVEIISN